MPDHFEPVAVVSLAIALPVPLGSLHAAAGSDEMVVLA